MHTHQHTHTHTVKREDWMNHTQPLFNLYPLKHKNNSCCSLSSCNNSWPLWSHVCGLGFKAMYGAVVSCCSLISDLVLATTADHSPYMALEPSGNHCCLSTTRGAIMNTLQSALRAPHTSYLTTPLPRNWPLFIHIWSDSTVQSQLDGASLEIVKKTLCDALSHPGSFTDTGRGSEQCANEK